MMVISNLHQQVRRILASRSRSSLLCRCYNTLGSPIKTNLEEWLKQGNQVKPSYVRGLIKNLRDTHCYPQALEASEWMCEQSVFNTFPEDYAARLHLVETVLGLDEAEKFFKGIPENMRDYSVYNNLLRSYTRSEKTLEKAESTFEKMRDLGFLLKPSPYNLMISLYGQVKKHDMVEKLQRELKENNVEVDSINENNVLSVGKVKEKSKTTVVFENFSEKNVLSLGKIKEEFDEKQREPKRLWNAAMETLNDKANRIERDIEMYGNVPGSKREVYRQWEMYKNVGIVNDDGYRKMISSLLKLDDVQGAEKIYGEWKPCVFFTDMSIPELLISQFRSEGNESKAEEVVKSIKKKRIMRILAIIGGGLILLGVLVGVCAAGLILLGVLVGVCAAVLGVGLYFIVIPLSERYPILYFVWCGVFMKYHPILFVTILGFLITTELND